MTFRKSKLIDNRPSWHPLRLYDKFGSQGDQDGTENLFQTSKQTGSFDVILAKRILCGVEMKIYERSLQALLSSAPRSRVLARLASLVQIGELARRLIIA